MVAGRTFEVLTLAALQAASTASGRSMLVRGREAAGDWGPPRICHWNSSNLSTLVAADEVNTGEGDGGVYVAPSSDKTGASGAWVFDHEGTLEIAWYGAYGVIDDTTDAYPAFAAAIGFASRADSRVKRIHARAGDYYVSAPVEINWPGLALIGDGPGSMWDTTASLGSETRIIGTSTTGAVVWVRKESCKVEDIFIDADTTRAAASITNTYADLNVGLRIEGDNVARDTGEGDCMNAEISRVLVKSQPNDGVRIVGKAYESILRMVYVKLCKGHGFACDDGTNSGRTVSLDDAVGTNYECGIITFESCKSLQNQGHAFRFGDTSDNNYTLRIMALNCECSQNCNDTAILVGAEDAQIFAHCDGLYWGYGAVSGNTLSGSGLVRAFCLMGNGGTIDNTRILQTDLLTPIYIQHQANRTTKGWRVINPAMRNFEGDYVVEIESTSIENVQVWIGSETQLTNSEVVDGTCPGLDVYYNGTQTRYFTERQVGTAAAYSLEQSDAGADEKAYRTVATGGRLDYQIGSDDLATWRTYMRVERTANSVDSVAVYNATGTLVSTFDSTGLVMGSGKDLYGQNGLKVTPTKLNNQAITTTPLTILDGSTSGKMWEIWGRATGAASPTGGFYFTVVGGTTTPLISAITNMTGASSTYAATVSGTNIQLAVGSGSATTDIFVYERVIA